MTLRFSSVLSVLLISSLSLFAGTTKEKFKVLGKCGMCEERIEAAAKSVDGVNSADWDQETQMMKVKYDPEVTTIDAIHKSIAAVGHDTEKASAPDEVYDKLEGCCKYERKSAKKAKSCCDNPSSGCGGK